MNPARVAALRLGMGERMPAFTVQINCGSGMQSIDTAYRYIQEGTPISCLPAAPKRSATRRWSSGDGVEWFAGMFTRKDDLGEIANVR